MDRELLRRVAEVVRDRMAEWVFEERTKKFASDTCNIDAIIDRVLADAPPSDEYARGVAEERERIRLILLSTAVAEVGSTYDAAWNGALDIAWEKISAAKER